MHFATAGEAISNTVPGAGAVTSARTCVLAEPKGTAASIVLFTQVDGIALAHTIPTVTGQAVAGDLLWACFDALCIGVAAPIAFETEINFHAECPITSVAFLANTGSLSWGHFGAHSVHGAATVVSSAGIYFCAMGPVPCVSSRAEAGREGICGTVEAVGHLMASVIA